MGDDVVVFDWLLVVESCAIGAWALFFAVAFNVGQGPTLKSAVTIFERRLAGSPRVVRFLAGAEVTATSVRTPRWQRFESRHGPAARTADAAIDTMFAPCLLAAWVLLILIPPIVVSSVVLPGGLAGPAWSVPAFFLMLNVTVFATTYVGKHHVWMRRAPLEWRLCRAVEVQHARLRRNRRSAMPAAAAEETVLNSTRQLESILRARYPSTPTNASEALASRLWDARLVPLVGSRATRLLSGGDTSPGAWFDTWLDHAATALQTDAPVRNADVDAGPLLAPDKAPKTGLVPLWSVTVAIAAVGVLTTPTSLHVLGSADWKLVASLAATAAAIASCIKIGTDWVGRFSTDR